MDNKEIIDALRCPGHSPIYYYCDKKSCIYCDYSCYDNLYRCNVQNLGLDAAAAMEKLTEEVDEWTQKAFTHQTAAVENLKECERLRAQVPKWISVSDHLPNVDKKKKLIGYESVYVIGLYNGESTPLIYERAEIRGKTEYRWKFVFDRIIASQSSVTHWMPLPEPPSKKCGDTDADN